MTRDVYFVSCCLVVDDHRLNNHENVQELRSNDLGREYGVAVLEYDGDSVVSDVPLSLHVLLVFLRVRQERRHVEHDLSAFVILVDRLDACCIVLDVQTAAKSSFLLIDN